VKKPPDLRSGGFFATRKFQRFAFRFFLADFLAAFFADDFLPAVLAFFVAFFFGVTFLAAFLAAFFAFLATDLAAFAVAPAVLVTASVACCSIDLSSSMSSPKVVEAGTIADSQIQERAAGPSLAARIAAPGGQRQLRRWPPRRS
jgi:hypothetical protein